MFTVFPVSNRDQANGSLNMLIVNYVSRLYACLNVGPMPAPLNRCLAQKANRTNYFVVYEAKYGSAKISQ